MKMRFAQLQRIDYNEKITEETHGEFLHHLQGALLLALREQGRLDAAEYRSASEGLKRQRQEQARRRQQEDVP